MFQLDFASRIPIYEQICNTVVKLASVGVLKPGDRLPPVRTLATELGINPNTVAKSYRILESDGYIYSTVGRGTFLTEKLSEGLSRQLIALEEFKIAVQNAQLYGVKKDELISVLCSTYEGGEKVD